MGQSAKDFQDLIRQEIAKIDWPCSIEIRAHKRNQGIRTAIPEAVTHVLTKFSSVIVLEEDVQVGPQAIDFANQMLEKFDHDSTIGHISLYNIVPTHFLERRGDPVRLSRYPESVAWATWASRWEAYNDQVSLADPSFFRILRTRSRNLWEALAWLVVFRDVKRERISSWAFRWVSSLWVRDMYCLSPNVNLVTYKGLDEGSHARFSAPWTELPLRNIDQTRDVKPQIDNLSEVWLSRKIFGGSVRAFALKVLSSLVLRFSRDRS